PSPLSAWCFPQISDQALKFPLKWLSRQVVDSSRQSQRFKTTSNAFKTSSNTFKMPFKTLKPSRPELGSAAILTPKPSSPYRSTPRFAIFPSSHLKLTPVYLYPVGDDWRDRRERRVRRKGVFDSFPPLPLPSNDEFSRIPVPLVNSSRGSHRAEVAF
ncbi:hypothetical protein B0H16DRAFT_1595710, partial [Mycena metata]